jgi:hypothetical protein
MPNLTRTRTLPPLVVLVVLAGCGGSKEGVEVPLPVVASGRGLEPGENDTGWQIEITRARGALHDLEFTVGGETHEESALAALWDLVVPSAHAHPGHAANGDVTGALAGPFLTDWSDDGESLGTAVLLEGDYQGANFYFRNADESDGLEADDVLLGHTMAFEGTASKGDVTLAIDAVVDVDVDTVLIGAPFVLEVATGATATLGLVLLPRDPVSGDDLFDGIDLGELDDGAGNAIIRPGSAAHNILRRAVQVHNFYVVDVR